MYKYRIEVLKYLVAKSRNACDLTKKLLIIMIEQSEGLTKEVCVSLRNNRDDFNWEEIESVGHGVHDMVSMNGTTHIDQLLRLMGSEFTLCSHYGYMDKGREGDPFVSVNAEGDESQKGYTIWLSQKFYSRQATLLNVTKVELEKIDLSDPTRYLKGGPKIERFPF